MKRFSDRNPRILAAVALVLIVALTYGALNLSHLPFINNTKTYQADFASAGGLATGDIVTIDGVRVGFVHKLTLEGNYVQISFTVSSDIPLGSATKAAASVETPLGTESIALTPAGPGPLTGPIPLSATSIPYTLVGDLATLTQQVENYNIPELVKALQTSSVTLQGTPTQEVAAALTGLARFSSVLAANHSNLATIVTQGSQLSTILSQRSGELVNLVGQGNLLLQVLQQRQADIKRLLDGTAQLSAQISALLGSDPAQFTTLLSNLENVSAALAKDSNSIGASIPLLAAFSRYAANVTGSGPFADVSIPTLLIPDNLIQQCLPKSAYPSTNPIVGCRP